MQDEEDQENQGDAQHPEDQENGENLEGQQLDQGEAEKFPLGEEDQKMKIYDKF